jgi:uncharacterized protein YhbP (UPF0306 family)
MEPTTRQLALNYLANHQVMSLATYGPQGLWSAAVFYASQEFNLYFLSAGHTSHAQNLAAQPRAAATIQEDYKDWPAIQGIQLEGTIHLLAGQEQETAVALYQSKYPFIAQPNDQIQRALSKVNWYRLTPDKLYFIDNTKGLGHRDEIILQKG